jgi:hypothetical protein
MDKLDREALHSDYQGEDDLDREALNYKEESLDFYELAESMFDEEKFHNSLSDKQIEQIWYNHAH